MKNVKIERLDMGLFAAYQSEDDGVQSVILSTANIMDLWVLAGRHPSPDEGAEALALFSDALEGLDNLVRLPVGPAPVLVEKKPPRRRVAPKGVSKFVRRSVQRAGKVPRGA